jgi:hypothetical protein
MHSMFFQAADSSSIGRGVASDGEETAPRPRISILSWKTRITPRSSRPGALSDLHHQSRPSVCASPLDALVARKTPLITHSEQRGMHQLASPLESEGYPFVSHLIGRAAIYVKTS